MLNLKSKNKLLLGINTAIYDETAVFLFDGNKIIREAVRGEKDKLLFLIDKILRKNKKRAKDLRGIIVASGPGHFAAIRQGIVAANALGYLLRVPAAGVRLSEFKNDEEFIKVGDRKLKQTKAGKIVMPFYGREPNITKSKKKSYPHA